MKLIFLGTSAAVPTLHRQVSATALDLGPEVLLFDCGEGTQLQYRRAQLRPGKLSRVLISHFHGDHLFGLPGLLTSWQMMSCTTPLCLLGPRGLKEYIDFVQRFTGFTLEFELTYETIDESSPARSIAASRYRIETFALDHGPFSVGYSVVEHDRPGRFNAERAEALGIPAGPLRSQLQAGKTIRLADGRRVKPEEVLGPPRRGRRVVYAVDTRPCASVLAAAEQASVLIHDATFDQTRQELASRTGHSTVVEAAQVARSANVRLLVLTHISGRYQQGDEEQLLGQARDVFPDTLLAHDLMRLEVPEA